MRRLWLKAPWWLWVLIWPPCIAVAMTILWHQAPWSPPRPGWTFSAIMGVVFGVVAGSTAGWWHAQWERQDRAILRLLPTEDRPVALRAAVRGPIPADPEIRRVVRQLINHRLTRPKYKKGQWKERLWFVLTLCIVYISPGFSWFWLTVAAISAYLTVHDIIKVRRLRQRSQALQNENGYKGGQTVSTHPDTQNCR
jgi:hypothetical protein